MHNRQSHSPESEQHFAQKIADGCESGEAVSASFMVYPTQHDYHRLRPDLRHIAHERYIRSTAGGVAAAQERNLPVVVREVRAKSYFAWLAHHGLEDITPHVCLYSCFAPMLTEPTLLAQLGVVAADPTLVHVPGPLPPAWRAENANEVEKIAVRLAVRHRFNHPQGVLSLVLAMGSFALDDEAVAAIAVLADRIASGMATESVKASFLDAITLATLWRNADQADRN